MEDEYLEQLNNVLTKAESTSSPHDSYLDALQSTLLNPSPASYRDEITFTDLPDDYGESIYDTSTLTGPEWDFYGRDLENMRAEKQPWVATAAAFLPRLQNKIISEVAKMPGMILGTLASPFMEGSLIENMFDNAWIRSIDDANKYINNEFLPVYLKKAVRDGKISDWIFDMEFWASEGADAIGYVAAMLVPGYAMAKLGVGAKMLKGANKGFNAMYKAVDEAQDAMKTLSLTQNNIDIFNATLANTFFEAGAESGNAMRVFEEELDYKLKNGDITQEEYDNLIIKKAEIGKNIFESNVYILLGPNLVMNKVLLGQGKPSIKYSDVVKDGAIVSELATPAMAKTIGRYAKTYGLGFGREGFWEEGMQSTAEKYYVAQAEGDDTTFVDTYFDVLKTTEGQKAVALGGLIGGPMNLYSRVKNDRSTRARGNSIINSMNTELDVFNKTLSDIFKKDKNGDYILVDDQKQIDPNSQNEFIKQLKTLEEVSGVLDVLKAIGENDVGDAIGIETLEHITGNQLFANLRDQLTSSFILPFIKDGEVGLEVLEQQLSSMEELTDKVNQYNKAFGSKLTKKSYVREIMSKARQAEEDYSRINTYLRSLVKLNSKIPKASKEQVESFYQAMENTYVINRLKRKYLNNLKGVHSKNLNDYTSEQFEQSDKRRKFTKNKEEYAENVLKDDDFYNLLKENVDTIDENLNSITKTEKALLNSEEANKAFKVFLRAELGIEDLSSDEVVKDTEETVDAIVESKDQAEVDEVKKKKKKKKKKVPKRVEEIVKQVEKKKRAELEEEESEEAEANIEGINLEKEYDVGDIIKVGETSYLIEINENTGEYELLDVNTNEVNEVLSNMIVSKLRIRKDLSSEEMGFEETIDKKGSQIINEVQDEKDRVVELGKDTTEGGHQLKHNNVKIIGYDNVTGKPRYASFSPNYEDYINNNEDKIGNKVTFGISIPTNEKHAKAITLFNSITVEDFNDIVKNHKIIVKKLDEVTHIINYLPIQVNLTDNIHSFLSGYPDNASLESEALDIFAIEQQLRTEIITEAINNGKSFDNINSKVVFQTGGFIQRAPAVGGVIPENDVRKVHGVVEEVPLYAVKDQLGNTYNENKKETSELNLTRQKDKEGYVYTKVIRPNGKVFPLKLNVKMINREEATLLTELIGTIFSDNLHPGSFLTELPQEIMAGLKNTFGKEMKLFNKPNKDIKISDLIDIFIHDNADSRYIFKIVGGSLHYGDNMANGTVFQSFKNNVINWLIDNKRKNVNFNILAGKRNIDQKRYKNYLLNNVISTDAIVNTEEQSNPLFLGSNIFIRNTVFDKPLQEETKGVTLSDKKESITDDIVKEQGEIEDLFNEEGVDTKC